MPQLTHETTAFIDGLTYDAAGLIPAIAQQHDTGEVLMMAWMNRDSILETLRSGRVVYWSRSRQALWRKGDTSGQVQTLKELRVDCDKDCLLVLVDQIGVACHTGRRNCFFTSIGDNSPKIIADVRISPDKLYEK
ncbi:phosphoribosyl-AMP cyclohydrolase [Dongia rigui]|uniref:Phosphoribosyl-AMP cyclohydrolase n=1 Tax=Dongia rigui TaxID=940149 RepID=A0ABU5DV73_9PROT|nr:phosphoribosyl-AMP cyclohydrolase [Dongia rigui]MDY0870496.1 phosphoribosyl-AMP cyclohydrolase [Dongia rigui]